jgi:hypothetical protein
MIPVKLKWALEIPSSLTLGELLKQFFMDWSLLAPSLISLFWPRMRNGPLWLETKHWKEDPVTRNPEKETIISFHFSTPIGWGKRRKHVTEMDLHVSAGCYQCKRPQDEDTLGVSQSVIVLTAYDFLSHFTNHLLLTGTHWSWSTTRLSRGKMVLGVVTRQRLLFLLELPCDWKPLDPMHIAENKISLCSEFCMDHLTYVTDSKGCILWSYLKSRFGDIKKVT